MENQPQFDIDIDIGSNLTNSAVECQGCAVKCKICIFRNHKSEQMQMLMKMLFWIVFIRVAGLHFSL